MVKHILVPTDGSEFAMVGVRYAAGLAKHYGATIHGLHVVDIKLLEGPFLRDISASLGTAPYVNYQGSVSLILEERGKAALAALRKVCAETGTPCETSQVTGIVNRAIIEKSGLADLIVMGRGGEHGQWLEGLAGSTASAVVRRADRPVLFATWDKPGGERFMIAYDGSPHASKALQSAAQMTFDWGAILRVLSVGGERATECIRDAKGYLSTHEIQVEYATRQGDPSEIIIAEAGEWKADLLVMGAYGHTKVRELVVGSTTAYAMNHAPCPLLLTR